MSPRREATIRVLTFEVLCPYCDTALKQIDGRTVWTLDELDKATDVTCYLRCSNPECRDWESVEEAPALFLPPHWSISGITVKGRHEDPSEG